MCLLFGQSNCPNRTIHNYFIHFSVQMQYFDFVKWKSHISDIPEIYLTESKCEIMDSEEISNDVVFEWLLNTHTHEWQWFNHGFTECKSWRRDSLSQLVKNPTFAYQKRSLFGIVSFWLWICFCFGRGWAPPQLASSPQSSTIATRELNSQEQKSINEKTTQIENRNVIKKSDWRKHFHIFLEVMMSSGVLARALQLCKIQRISKCVDRCILFSPFFRIFA